MVCVDKNCPVFRPRLLPCEPESGRIWVPIFNAKTASSDWSPQRLLSLQTPFSRLNFLPRLGHVFCCRGRNRYARLRNRNSAPRPHFRAANAAAMRSARAKATSRRSWRVLKTDSSPAQLMACWNSRRTVRATHLQNNSFRRSSCYSAQVESESRIWRTASSGIGNRNAATPAPFTPRPPISAIYSTMPSNARLNWSFATSSAADDLLAIDDLHHLPAQNFALQELRYTLDDYENRGATILITSTQAPMHFAEFAAGHSQPTGRRFIAATVTPRN